MKQWADVDTALLHQLQQQIAAEDEKAFRRLFDLFAERLTHFSFSIVRDRAAAIAIMDEVFVKIWKQRASFAAVQNVVTYLYTAIKNTSLNHLSKKAHEQVLMPFDCINIQLTATDTPEQSFITAEMFRKMHAAVEALPAKCKMIFKLVREDGLKYKQVADILNISPKTVDAQMVIAVKK